MAIVVPNKGLYELGKNDASAMDVRQAVWTGTRVASDATVYDWDDLSDVDGDSGLTEAAATNYTPVTSGGQDLANVTYTEDDATNDRAEWRADAYTINSVGSGETWTVVANYRWTANTLAGGILLSLDTPSSSLVTNGGNVTLPQFAVNVVRA